MNHYFDVSLLPPYKDFEDAASSILSFLHARLGFGLWMVTRTQDDDWIVLKAEDHGYRVKAGDVFCWSDSFCSRMVQGLGPRIAPRSADIQPYANAPIGAQVPISAYIGVPISDSEGGLFGTLCAIDPDPKPQTIEDELPLIEEMARILSTILGLELQTIEAKRSLERAKADSEMDHLTELYNRRGWDKQIAVEEDRCRRYGHAAAVVILDLDDLKTVNDFHGHAAGDQLLKTATKLLQSSVRPFDIVARLGGDEFGVLLIEAEPATTNKIVERIRSRFADDGIAASIGWAARDPRNDFKLAIKNADEKMYAEKQQSKSDQGQVIKLQSQDNCKFV